MAPGLKRDFGAGLRLSKDNVEPHPAGPPQKEGLSQTERMFQVASTLFAGILSINASQFIGAPLKFINPEYYDAYMAFTKQSFSVLVNTMTQWWAPTVVRVSGDSSMHGQLQQLPDGSLRCNFPERIVMMANHQLYTDWLYLWWIAYTNDMHGRIHIIMKESLKKIPFIGWGCQFYNFIFVARKWEEDRTRFQQHLQKLNNPQYPMWLIIFPEGTNLSKVTREKSAQWAAKNDLQDMKHQLLPHSTGLRFCLEQLQHTTPWLYDCTIGYEGVPPGKFGQDIFTLRSSFFEGRPPKSVNMHWRRFRVADIPINDPKAFEVWLRNRWREKDYMLEYFSRTGRFPTDQNWMLKQTHQRANGDVDRTSTKTESVNYIETQVKSRSWEEFLLIFAPIGAFVIVLFLFYNASQGGTMPGANGEGAPKEWNDVMNQAAGLFNSVSKLSEIQQLQATGDDPEEDAEEEPATRRPLLRRAISSSSTAVSSDSGTAKYRFVPVKNPAGAIKPVPKRAASEAPKRSTPAAPKRASSKASKQRVVKLANGMTVPLKTLQNCDAKSDSGVKTSAASKAPQSIATSSGVRLKVNPQKKAPAVSHQLPKTTPIAKSRPKQPGSVAASGSTLKLTPSSKPAVKAVSKAANPIKPVPKKAPSLVSTTSAPPKITRPSNQNLSSPNRPQGTNQNVPQIKTASKIVPAKAGPAPQKPKAEATTAEKSVTGGKARQLANGTWINVGQGAESEAQATDKAKVPRQLANGMWVS